MKNRMLTLVACLSLLPGNLLLGGKKKKGGTVDLSTTRASVAPDTTASQTTSVASAASSPAVSATAAVAVASAAASASSTSSSTSSSAAATSSASSTPAATSSWTLNPLKLFLPETAQDNYYGHDTRVLEQLRDGTIDLSDENRLTHRTDHAAQQMRAKNDTAGIRELFELGGGRNVPFTPLAYKEGRGAIDDAIKAEKDVMAKRFQASIQRLQTLKAAKTLIKNQQHARYKDAPADNDSDDEDYKHHLYIHAKYQLGDTATADALRKREKEAREKKAKAAAQQSSASRTNATATTTAAAITAVTAAPAKK